MQIIQNIREKGAAIIIVVIALSLIGFILMDSSVGGGSLFGGGNQNAIGKVNGDDIEVAEFNNKVLAMEDMEQQRSGQRPSAQRTFAIRDQVWNQMVAEKLFYEEADKLGIQLTPKELSAILLSNEQNNPFLQEQGMIDPTTGKLDMAKAQEAFANIKKAKGEQKDAINQQLIDPLRINTAVNKYSSLINASAYYPAWMLKADQDANNNFAVISYVNIPYNEISDSSIKITDADITAYVNKNKGLFKTEAGRKISYVTFSQLPTAADSAREFEAVQQLKADFAADTNAANFAARNASAIDFNDVYAPVSKITTTGKDSLLAMPQGVVYGPYVDQGMYVLAKKIGTRQLPDSASARHILISTAKQNENAMDDATAKNLADSLLNVVKAGGNFAALATQYSADPGSKEKGGDLGTFGWGAMVPEFNDYVFENPVGSKGVVKTQFGYHVIDVTSQKNFQPAYKIAYFGREIVSGDETINAAMMAATQASAQKTKTALVNYAQKNGLAVKEATNVLKENDYALSQNMPDARQVVKWAFDANVGEVSEPFTVGDDFVVAVLDDKFEKGTLPASSARQGAEALVRNEKKAAIIKTKLGAAPTLQAAATAYNKQVLQAGADSTITFGAQLIQGLGVEPKVIGAAFNKNYQAKPTPPFAGEAGVYVMQVNTVGSKGAIDVDQAEQMMMQKLNTQRQQMGNWYEGLREVADVKDNRKKFF